MSARERREKAYYKALATLVVLVEDYDGRRRHLDEMVGWAQIVTALRPRVICPRCGAPLDPVGWLCTRCGALPTSPKPATPRPAA
jgi:hypothetical protein